MQAPVPERVMLTRTYANDAALCGTLIWGVVLWYRDGCARRVAQGCAISLGARKQIVMRTLEVTAKMGLTCGRARRANATFHWQWCVHPGHGLTAGKRRRGLQVLMKRETASALMTNGQSARLLPLAV